MTDKSNYYNFVSLQKATKINFHKRYDYIPYLIEVSIYRRGNCYSLWKIVNVL